MLNWHTTFDGNVYDDPRDELKGRAERARAVGDKYVAVPISLIEAAVNVRQCKSTTLVRGNRETNVMIQIVCERDEHGAGNHRNGKITWD